MTRTVLITGATGQVSGALIRALAGADDLILRALVRDASKGAALRQQGVELAMGDLDEPESLSAAFDGVSDLWLLNGVSPRQPENSMNAVWAARRAGVERVVRMSAVGAAHDAPTRNGRLHALSDAELAASGMSWTVLRPHFFMQNLLMVAPSVARQGEFYWDMGEGKLGMIDVRDIGDFAACVLMSAPAQHHGKTYTLTGPATISMAEAATQLSQGIERPVRYVAVPHEAARQSMLQNGMPAWVANLLVEYGTAYAANWGNFTTSHVQELLGRPARSVLDFARDHAAAFREAT
jgi:uncharacterized protein YbjT (DUF2867 family)